MLKRLAILACLPLGGCIHISIGGAFEVLARLPTPDATLEVQESGVNASLRGVYALDESSCWASGSAGTCLRTTDAGQTWQRLEVPNADELDFRDVHPFDNDNALLMTAGTPARIYRTSDGGAHWTIVHEDHREGAFFDGMDFWDDHRGVLFGDPIDGEFTILLTEDGGRSWTHADPASIPDAMEGEAGFAASGTCVATGPGGQAIIALGGNTGLDGARILLSRDYANTWESKVTSVPTSASAGLFSVAYFSGGEYLGVGGDYAKPSLQDLAERHENDPGATYTSQPIYSEPPELALLLPMPNPYRSCVAVGSLDGQDVFLSTGWAINSVASHLNRYQWRWIDLIPGTFGDAESNPEAWFQEDVWYQHAASFAPGTARAWIVGAEGKITRIDLAVPEE